jgi:hypothetical protein
MKLNVKQSSDPQVFSNTIDDGTPLLSGSPLGVLHMSAALLVDRYLEEPDPCVAVCLSRQFRLISEDSSVPDAELRVLYRTLAARWHQMAIQSVFPLRPTGPWLDEFAPEGRG